MPIEPGISAELRHTVQESDTARHCSGETLPPVYSTPLLIRLLERTAHHAIQPLLAPGQGSVGSVVNIRHLAATPVGFEVRARAEVTAVEGRRVRFKVEAWDGVDKIAEGEHERFVIDLDRFIEKLARKAGSRSPGN